LHRLKPVLSLVLRAAAQWWVAPVKTGATSLVSLLSCLMATLRVGCTGFSAGATPLVSARAANPQCNGTGLHRFQCRCYAAGFCASRQSAMQWNRVAPVETGATSLVLSLSCLMATLRVGCTG
jgi:hypothetical protein